MALWVCSGCATQYASGLECCPNCGSGGRVEQGSTGGSVLPRITVECTWDDCLDQGTQREVYLKPAALGVLELPTLLCARCGTHMLIVNTWRGGMPKISRHGGPTNKHDEPDVHIPVQSSGEHESELRALPDAAPVQEAEEIREGEQPSAGNNSSTSTEKPLTSQEQSEPSHQQPAPTTENPSAKARTGNSTARSTGGRGTAGAPKRRTGGRS